VESRWLIGNSGDGELAEYIDKALDQAVYEIIEGEGTYWGEIPGLQGVLIPPPSNNGSWWS
jgi:hypothetical protein